MSIQIVIVVACLFLALLAAMAVSAANHRSSGDQVVVVIPKNQRRGGAHLRMTLSAVRDSPDLNDDDYVVLSGDARNQNEPREMRVRDVRSVWDLDELDTAAFGSESRAGPWLTGQHQTEAGDEPKPARHSPAAWLGWMFVLFLGAAFLIIRLA